jgi:hypothetical protein
MRATLPKINTQPAKRIRRNIVLKPRPLLSYILEKGTRKSSTGNFPTKSQLAVQRTTSALPMPRSDRFGPSIATCQTTGKTVRLVPKSPRFPTEAGPRKTYVPYQPCREIPGVKASTRNDDTAKSLTA